MPKFKSILKPEGSIVAGIAVAGSVWAIYQLNIGNVSSAHMTDANHGSLESSRKKAGYMAFVFVGGITLITRDANVGLLGFASVIAMEINYRHAIMSNPNNGEMQPPAESYTPAGVTPINAGANAPSTGYVNGPGF